MARNAGRTGGWARCGVNYSASRRPTEANCRRARQGVDNSLGLRPGQRQRMKKARAAAEKINGALDGSRDWRRGRAADAVAADRHAADSLNDPHTRHSHGMVGGGYFSPWHDAPERSCSTCAHAVGRASSKISKPALPFPIDLVCAARAIRKNVRRRTGSPPLWE